MEISPFQSRNDALRGTLQLLSGQDPTTHINTEKFQEIDKCAFVNPKSKKVPARSYGKWYVCIAGDLRHSSHISVFTPSLRIRLFAGW
ncbi:hypothetical protein BAUCODRAFT_39761 [Baudoinia panamericana UAMH 10762]|uniref:Uncharacterized protein n=1 Tax=Baudoinia panamericana (strain UAMH 10762) TaxID=717646 RepID=M2MWK1_BAUPA|nr:uncharacterized protein BAUCODRAFT_39761 [Baudoinia panamericana UAMH 10762]EMC90964.1 hypothetical protein BAUCODRAFT_39761 [Baudoinia panamericana UAMH 10762]